MSGCFLLNYSVDRSDFVRNVIGINSNAVNMPLIVRNTFEVGYPSTLSKATGIRLNGGTGYTVEANSFIGEGSVGPGAARNVGILVRETGSGDNQIRGNSFNDLYVGNLSNGVNRGGNDPLAHGLSPRSLGKCSSILPESARGLWPLKVNNNKFAKGMSYKVFDQNESERLMLIKRSIVLRG